MNKGTLSIGGACVVAAGILGATLYFGGLGSGPGSKDSRIIVVNPPELPGLGDGGVKIEKPVIENRSASRVTQLKADHFSPQEESIYEVEKPVVHSWFVGTNRWMELRADRGTVLAPGDNPQSGRLEGNVFLTMHETPDGQEPDWDSPAHAVMHLKLDWAEFDLDLGTVASRSPVDLYTSAAEFHGVGLQLTFNQLRNSLAFLRIDKGDFLRLYRSSEVEQTAEADEVAGVSEVQAVDQAQADATESVGSTGSELTKSADQQSENDKAGSPKSSDPSQVAEAKPSSSKSSSQSSGSNKPSERRELQYYEAIFQGDVQIDTADNAYAMRGDQLQIFFGVTPDDAKQDPLNAISMRRVLDGMRGQPTPAGAMRLAHAFAATGFHSDQHMLSAEKIGGKHTLDWMTSSNTARPTMIRGVSQITPKGDQDVTVRWTGTLEVVPSPSLPEQLDSVDDAHFQLSGEEAVLRTQEGQTVTGRALAYNTLSQRTQVFGDLENPVELFSPEHGKMIGQKLVAEPTKGRFVLTGPLTLDAVMSGQNIQSDGALDVASASGETTGSEDEVESIWVQAQGRLELTLYPPESQENQDASRDGGDGEGSGGGSGGGIGLDLGAIRLARFFEDVSIKHPRLEAEAEKLSLLFDPPASESPPGSPPESPPESVPETAPNSTLEPASATNELESESTSETGQTENAGDADTRDRSSSAPARLKVVVAEGGAMFYVPQAGVEALTLEQEQEQDSQTHDGQTQASADTQESLGESSQAQIIESDQSVELELGLTDAQDVVVSGDQVRLTFVPSEQDANQRVPSQFTGVGNVVISRSDFLLDADRLVAMIRTDETGQITLGQTVAAGGVEAKVAQIAGVNETDPSASSQSLQQGLLEADRLWLDPQAQQMLAFGDEAQSILSVKQDDLTIAEKAMLDQQTVANAQAAQALAAPARIGMQGGFVQAQVISLDQSQGRVAVLGQGSGRFDQVDQAMQARWSRGLVINDEAGVVSMLGDVEVASYETQTQTQADQADTGDENQDLMTQAPITQAPITTVSTIRANLLEAWFQPPPPGTATAGTSTSGTATSETTATADETASPNMASESDWPAQALSESTSGENKQINGVLENQDGQQDAVVETSPSVSEQVEASADTNDVTVVAITSESDASSLSRQVQYVVATGQAEVVSARHMLVPTYESQDALEKPEQQEQQDKQEPLDDQVDPGATSSTELEPASQAQGDEADELAGAELTRVNGLVIRGPKLIFNRIDQRLDVPGAGQMMLEDYRPESKADKADKDDSATQTSNQALEQTASSDETSSQVSGRGATLFTFEKSMRLDALQSEVLMDGGVTMVHAKLKSDGKLAAGDELMQVDCYTLLAEFTQTSGLAFMDAANTDATENVAQVNLDATSETSQADMPEAASETQPELIAVSCDGSVQVRNEGRLVACDFLRYKAEDQAVYLTAAPGRYVRVTSQDQNAPVTNRWVRWDLATDTIRGVPAGPGVVPIVAQPVIEQTEPIEPAESIDPAEDVEPASDELSNEASSETQE